MVNHYEILNISATASKQEIKTAFKKLALLYHPDKNKGFEEKFKLINEAYQVLSNDQKKYTYDRQLQYHQFSRTKARESSTYVNFEEYSYTTPSKPYDHTEQGRHYESPPPKEKKNTEFYVIGFTIFIIIATASLLFGMFMNNYAAKTHFENAKAKYENEEYVNAIIELNRAIEFNEDFAEAYEFRGDIKVKLNKLKLALFDYKKAKQKYKSKSSQLEEKINNAEQLLSSQF